MAYRVLGKFGGSNRKMLKESQKLHYIVTEVQGPSITVEFSDCKASLQLPMEKVKAEASKEALFVCSKKTALIIKDMCEPTLREGLSLSAGVTWWSAWLGSWLHNIMLVG